MLDYLIVGSGPAGIQLAYFLKLKNRQFKIVEQAENVGHFFRMFPRHRQLISINKPNTGFTDKEMNLRWDWNSLLNDKLLFTERTDTYLPKAEDLCDYLDDFCRVHELDVELGFAVTRISKDNGIFCVDAEDGRSIEAKRVVIATGFNKEKLPSFPGSEFVEPYSTFDIHPQRYKNKRVLIIGKGNSAFETADSLLEHAASIHLCSPNSVKLAWHTHYVGHVRAVNNNFLDTYQLKSQNVILDAEIDEIKLQNGKYIVDITYTHAMGEKRRISYDHVISATGWQFDDTIFDDAIKPDLCDMKKFPKQTSCWESVNVENLFFAGVLMHYLDYRKTMSGFIHGFRYNVEALSKILNERFHDQPWPTEEISNDPQELANKVSQRITQSSSVFLQPGFFCDVIKVDRQGSMQYVNDVPLMYAKEYLGNRGEEYYTLTLEYGDWKNVNDPFYVQRDPEPSKAHLAEYIHPIVRHYKGDFLVEEFHVPEDLENVYTGAFFVNVFYDFFVKKHTDREQLAANIGS